MAEKSRELAGRAALVTGSSKNIGRAIAVALAEGGASVLVHGNRDRDGAEETAVLVRRAGGRAAIALADLSNPGAAAQLVEATHSAFERFDILVANAAIRPESAFSELTYEAWRSVMAIGLDSAFLLAKAALPFLRHSDQAAIVENCCKMSRRRARETCFLISSIGANLVQET